MPGSSSGKPGALQVGARPLGGRGNLGRVCGRRVGKGRVALPQGAPTGRSPGWSTLGLGRCGVAPTCRGGGPRRAGCGQGSRRCPDFPWISRPRGPGSALELG